MSELTLDELFQAPEDQTRAILRALCQDTQILRRALRYFESLQSLHAIHGPDGISERKSDDEILICVQCDDAFYECFNYKKSCYYHWGECQPYRWTIHFAGYDGRIHGPVDTKDNREDRPKGFVWTCCDKTYDEEGCARGFHEEDPRKSKRECGYEPSDLENDEHNDVDEDDDEDEEDEGEDEDEDMDVDVEDEEEEEDDDEEPVFLYEKKK